MSQRDFLRHPLSDVFTVALFGLAGAFLEARLWPVPSDIMVVAGALATALGPLGCAIERGQERRLSWVSGAILAAAGAAVYACALRVWSPDLAWTSLGGRVLGAAALGLGLTRWGPRLDRGEAGWREAARRGPPTGSSATVLAFAAWRPAPVRALERVTLPLSWALRIPCLLAIRVYQLTLSRLMPPACQFEPTCSRYGLYAIFRHGALRGGLLTGIRILRCSPLTQGGFDPVPPVPEDPACRTPGLSCPPSRPPCHGATPD